jgi:hypothetical protein
MFGYQKKGLISRIFDAQKNPPFGDVFVINLQQEWSLLIQEPEAPYNNATSRGLRRIPHQTGAG